MKFSTNILFLALLFLSLSCFSQKDSTATQNIFAKKKKQLTTAKYNPLSPSKAAFYSAVFPGGGQIYNKKYWKAPIVWAAIGTSMYFYFDNDKQYDRYRTAFKQRSQGLQDEFTRDDGSILISTSGLENAQTVLRKNRDMSLLVGALLYILNIVEASVNAHLLQFDTDDSLSIKPILTQDPLFNEAPKVGLRLHYSF